MRERRELICGRLDALPGLFSYQKPEGPTTFSPGAARGATRTPWISGVRLMREAKVVAVPGSAFGPTGEGHIRMSYCMSREQIGEAFDRLEAWWRSSGRSGRRCGAGRSERAQLAVFQQPHPRARSTASASGSAPRPGRSPPACFLQHDAVAVLDVDAPGRQRGEQLVQASGRSSITAISTVRRLTV